MKTYYIGILIAMFLNAPLCILAQKSDVLPTYVPESKELHNEISEIDSILFDGYNSCKLEVFASFVSEDIEFYHDRGGLSTSKKELMDALRDNICDKVKRELLDGSIEVYPIPGFGAVQMGVHRFYNLQEQEQGPSRFAKFVHTWKEEDGNWKLYRVISLH